MGHGKLCWLGAIHKGTFSSIFWLISAAKILAVAPYSQGYILILRGKSSFENPGRTRFAVIRPQ